MKKKIIFINNHFQYSDGTVRALIGLVNNLDPDKFDITVKSVYRCDRRLAAELRDGIKLETCFGFYFKGFNRIVNLISPRFWYNRFINGKYDIEVAFQCDLPTKMVGVSANDRAVHVEWMHCWDLYAKEYAVADQVVCVSRYNAERTYKEMDGKVNVTCCYNLIDDNRIYSMAADKIPDGCDFRNRAKPLFVSVGRISEEKGYKRLVNIAAKLKAEGYEFTLVIVGGGPEEPLVRAAIEDKGLEDTVFMTGALNNPYNITCQADCFICSSFIEGYSTACTEAAILGVPIITTKVSGGQEIIDTCGCGLVTELDDDSLESGIKSVLDNPSVLEEWKSVLACSKERFGLKQRVLELNELFERLYVMSEEKGK